MNRSNGFTRTCCNKFILYNILSEDCYGEFIAKSNNNQSVSLYMKKRYAFVFGVLILLVILVPMMTTSVQAFNKHGPTPIPGNLIPFPGMGHDKSHDKNHPVIPSHKK